MCRKEFWDNNHFGSRNSTIEIWALEIPESRMSSKRHSDTLCVKYQVSDSGLVCCKSNFGILDFMLKILKLRSGLRVDFEKLWIRDRDSGLGLKILYQDSRVIF